MKYFISPIFLAVFAIALTVSSGSNAQNVNQALSYIRPYSVLKTIRLPIRIALFAFRLATTIVRTRLYSLTLQLNDICRTLTNIGVVGRSEVDSENLSLVLINKIGVAHEKLDNCEKLLEHAAYHKDRNLTIFIPGWMNKLQGGIPTEVRYLIEAYNARDEENFAIYDLYTYLNTLYSFAAYNIRDSGEYLGRCLAKLSDSVQSIHLIGASLGAHIAAVAAKTLEAMKNRKITRLTALDPSKACSNNFLSRNSAKFVDVIHTTKIFGTVEAVGHADFYVDRMRSLSSGCNDFICSHFKPIWYFAHSVFCDYSFLGTRCESSLRFRMGRCRNNMQSVMGYKTPHYTRGTFYLDIGRCTPPHLCNTSITTPAPATTTTQTVETTTAMTSLKPTTESPETTTISTDTPTTKSHETTTISTDSPTTKSPEAQTISTDTPTTESPEMTTISTEAPTTSLGSTTVEPTTVELTSTHTITPSSAGTTRIITPTPRLFPDTTIITTEPTASSTDSTASSTDFTELLPDSITETGSSDEEVSTSSGETTSSNGVIVSSTAITASDDDVTDTIPGSDEITPLGTDARFTDSDASPVTTDATSEYSDAGGDS